MILIDETKKQKKKQQKNLPRIPKRIILLNEMNCIRLQSEIICNTADRRRERRSSALNRSYLIYAKQLEIVYHSFPFRETRTKHNSKDSIALHRHIFKKSFTPVYTVEDPNIPTIYIVYIIHLIHNNTHFA